MTVQRQMNDVSHDFHPCMQWKHSNTSKLSHAIRHGTCQRSAKSRSRRVVLPTQRQKILHADTKSRRIVADYTNVSAQTRVESLS